MDTGLTIKVGSTHPEETIGLTTIPSIAALMAISP